MPQPIQAPLAGTRYKTNMVMTPDDNTFGLWMSGSSSKLWNNTKKNKADTDAKRKKFSWEANMHSLLLQLAAASAENIKELEGTL